MRRRPGPSRPSLPILVLVVLLGLASSPGCTMAGHSVRLEAPREQASEPRLGHPIAASLPLAQATGVAGASGALEAWSRKLIRNASLVVEVEDVGPAVQALAASAVSAGGFVLQSQEYGGGRRASVVLRVPAPAFEETLVGVGGLGEVKQRSIQGEDVTEEYLDLEARIRNAEQVRVRLIKLLEEATTVEEMLRIEQELARIQERIEQMRGRLNYLGHRVDLATIAVDLRKKERGLAWLLSELF